MYTRGYPHKILIRSSKSHGRFLLRARLARDYRCIIQTSVRSSSLLEDLLYQQVNEHRRDVVFNFRRCKVRNYQLNDKVFYYVFY